MSTPTKRSVARLALALALLVTATAVAEAREVIYIQAVNYCATDEGPCCNGCKCGIHCDGDEGWNFSSVRCEEEAEPE